MRRTSDSSEVVQLISLAEHGPRACSVENAEVGLEHDRREADACIAWLSKPLASGRRFLLRFVRRGSVETVVSQVTPMCETHKSARRRQRAAAQSTETSDGYEKGHLRLRAVAKLADLGGGGWSVCRSAPERVARSATVDLRSAWS